MRNGADFKNASDFNVESVRAAKLTSQQLPAATGSSFLLLFTDSQRTYASPAFEQEVRSALATLASDRRVTSIQTPYSAPPEQALAMISTDRHSVIAAVNLSLDFASARQQFAELRAEVHATALQVSTDGDVAVASDFDTSWPATCAGPRSSRCRWR